MTKDWQLLRQLEYQGEYECRYTCSMCKHFCGNGDYENCTKLNDERVKVSGKNNICKHFEARIKNPSSPEFRFSEYLEFLMSDFYRPWTVNTEEKVNEVYCSQGLYIDANGGWHTKMGYSPIYQSYDLPYCRIHSPNCYVKLANGHKFEVDYRLYRKCEWYENNIIKYIKHYWKDKPAQRKYNSEINGEYEVE